MEGALSYLGVCINYTYAGVGVCVGVWVGVRINQVLPIAYVSERRKERDHSWIMEASYWRISLLLVMENRILFVVILL